VQSDIVWIDFAEVSYINYDIIIHRNFNIIILLNVESIVMILNMMLTNKRDKLLIISYTVFSYLFLTSMKCKEKCLESIDLLCILKDSDSECCQNFIKCFSVEV